MRKIFQSIQQKPSLQILIIILVIGATLRYYGIPHAENTDEYNEVMEALRVASGKLNYERWWKKGYQNILAITYGIYFIVGYLFHIFDDPWDFATKIARNMEPLFLIGRYLTATLGTASIGLLFMIGRKLYNERIALIAAALFAIETINVWTSHLVNTDVPLTFFFLLSFYFISRFYETGKRLDYIAAAFFGAIAINIKMIGVGIGILFIMSHIIRCIKEKRSKLDFFFTREIFDSVIAFLVGIIISNPTILIGLNKFIIFHYGVYSNIYDEVPYAIEGSGYYTYLLLMYKNFGLILFMMIGTGVLYAFYKLSYLDIILLTFLCSMFLILGGTKFLIQNRYLMTLFPVLFLLLGRFLTSMVEGIPIHNRSKDIILVVICSLILVYPLINSVVYVRTLIEENTSVVSKKWIEENIPTGSKILMDAGRTIITFGPRLNQSRAKLEEQMGVIKNLSEGQTFDSALVKIVDSYAAVYFELLLRTMPNITYDITTSELGKNLELPEYYKKNGYEYYIHITDFQERAKNPLWRKKYPKSAVFYDTFDQYYQLLMDFNPSVSRGGFRIMVYKIQ